MTTQKFYDICIGLAVCAMATVTIGMTVKIDELDAEVGTLVSAVYKLYADLGYTESLEPTIGPDTGGLPTTPQASKELAVSQGRRQAELYRCVQRYGPTEARRHLDCVRVRFPGSNAYEWRCFSALGAEELETEL